MNVIKDLDNMYNHIEHLASLMTDEFCEEVFSKLTELRSELVFIKKAMATNDKRIFESVYVNYASDYNHESGFYFKRNYDLGEGWTGLLDAYRAGKVKKIQDWVASRRRTKKPKKKKTKKAAPTWSNQIFSDDNGSYKISSIYEFIDNNRVPVSELNVADLAKTNLVPSPEERRDGSDYPGSPKFIERAEQASLTFPIIAVRYNDGTFIADGVHRLWKARALGHNTIKGHVISEQDLKKIKKEEPINTQASTLKPIDSYCDSKKNIDYWEELLDGEDDEAVKDFIKYIKEVKC